jgi:hypothetical protein
MSETVILWVVLVLSAIVLLATMIGMFAYLLARINSMDSQHSEAIKGAAENMSSFARDVDTIFGNYTHDPNHTISTSVSSSTAAIQLDGRNTTELRLGRGTLSFDDNASTMTVGAQRGTARLIVLPDSVEVRGKLRIGALELSASSEGLKVCNRSTNKCTVLKT